MNRGSVSFGENEIENDDDDNGDDDDDGLDESIVAAVIRRRLLAVVAALLSSKVAHKRKPAFVDRILLGRLLASSFSTGFQAKVPP
jgi:hypothetical protein